MTIDHDRRRQQIAEIAIDLIAEEGLGAATIRHIAAQANFSTAAITSYFAGKHELLVWTFEVLAHEGIRRFEEAFAKRPFDPMTALLTMVPGEQSTLRRWKAYLAFWDQAARSPDIARLINNGAEYGWACTERLILALEPQATNVLAASELLNAIVQGLSMQIVVAPERWPEPKIRTTLTAALEMIRTTALTVPSYDIVSPTDDLHITSAKT